MVGRSFGRLLVIEKADKKNGRKAWLCRCSCGTEKVVMESNLLRGTSSSCGCLQKELLSNRRLQHGGWANNEPLFGIWCGIKRRCNSAKDVHYKEYGGRGIRICKEWQEDYRAFRSWALQNGYQSGLSIDRIDVNGNYNPSNCRWATSKEQQNNRRSCRYYSYNNETHTIKEWSEILDINYQTLYSRITKYGYSFEEAINTTKRQKSA